jgi:hypothetical protein
MPIPVPHRQCDQTDKGPKAQLTLRTLLRDTPDTRLVKARRRNVAVVRRYWRDGAQSEANRVRDRAGEAANVFDSFAPHSADCWADCWRNF